MSVIGHLGKDAEMNTVGGKQVINFSVAHTEKYKDAQGQQREKTLWVDAAWWSDRAGILPYLKKGSQVYVDGQPDIRLWTGKDGKSGASLVLRVSTVQLVGSSGGGVNHTQQVNEMTARNYYSDNASEIKEPEDTLPF